MAYRYYRYTTHVAQDIGSALGEMGGVIVRIDNRAGATEVTVAMSENRKLAAESPLGAGVEVSEEDVLNLGD